MSETGQVQLRNEKIRNIIGEIPPALIRYGITIIFILFCLLFVAFYFLPYTENITCNIIISTNDTGLYAKGKLPYSYINAISINTPVNIELEGFNKDDFGLINGTISHINDSVVVENNKNYFYFDITFLELHGLKNSQTGIGNIIISDKTIFENIFK